VIPEVVDYWIIFWIIFMDYLLLMNEELFSILDRRPTHIHHIPHCLRLGVGPACCVSRVTFSIFLR
jgi:hypothetical protein